MERDEQAVSKNDMVRAMVEKQSLMEQMMVDLAKDENNGAGMNFRELKTRYLKEWRQTKLKMRGELGMKLAAINMGKDPEDFVKNKKMQIANA
jgi:hypothetical protein